MTSSSRARLRNAVVLASVVGLLATFFVGEASAQFITVNNPVISQRADTAIYKHTDGYYYMTASVPDYKRVELRRATTLQGLGTAATTNAFVAPSSGALSGWIWAPDIQLLRRRLVHVLLGVAEHRAVRPAAVLDPQHLRQPDDLLVERAAAVHHRLGVLPARRGVVRQPRRALLRVGAGQPAAPTTTATCTSPG